MGPKATKAADDSGAARSAIGGIAGWLWARMRSHGRAKPRLALLERITLAPRQSLALVEAEGRRFLVATAAEGGAAFYALDGERSGCRTETRRRASW